MKENPVETRRIAGIRQSVFAKEIPKRTWVFMRDDDHTLYGRTTGGYIYDHTQSQGVRVTRILGNPKLRAIWPYESVVKMGDDEKKERLIEKKKLKKGKK